ncbi:antibiotic biosynthesis monooxygenase [Prauserella marina]|uniref:Antibiotic biosynthesis monooxygenase n=1 Tax=Prauserella marina TaxID=530584 RepID=A0A222VTH0_9PSEU|nr:antibiotic biosynthesis monooxygenase family protein [Prauserella marina]ASR37208.1 antibiotic biosynthesis monooxygenase [Prauserella marina]PWV72525.1 antibiotic biosynthesis monooxygenase [Prauserella marina]SDD77961.1 Antibiotic biosynthesis monooxygenase [Prauserella marina]
MLIIAGHVEVDPGNRDAYVAAHHDLIARARAARGCLDVAISADPLDPARVNVFERWDTQENLDAWRAVAAAPDSETAIVADNVMAYEVSGERPPFG